MKQTVPLLVCLCALLALVTGVLIAYNNEINQLLIITQRALNAANAQLENDAKREAENKAAVLKWEQQLADALLSVEEANMAVEMQVDKNHQLMMELQTLEASVAIGGVAHGKASLREIRETGF